jgi:hypothetical protein
MNAQILAALLIGLLAGFLVGSIISWSMDRFAMRSLTRSQLELTEKLWRAEAVCELGQKMIDISMGSSITLEQTADEIDFKWALAEWKRKGQ